MTMSMRTCTIVSIVAVGLFFLPAANADHPHDAPGTTSGPGMMGEGEMMGKGGMMGMGGMMAMMNQMNQMMESCSKMMDSANEDHGSGVPEEMREMDVPAIP